MLLTDRQVDRWIEWFTKNYEQYCARTPDGRLDIPVVYCDNPEEEEKKHAKLWLDEIKKLMWSNANKKYRHRGGRTETYAEAQFNSLWLYNWPIFKSNSEKDAQHNNTTRQENLWDVHEWEWEKQEVAWSEE